MAIMVPELSPSQLSELPSVGERKVYEAIRDQAPNRLVALFRVGWILKRPNDGAKDGEADFVICDPALGFICVEVKGGGVKCDADSGSWYSVDRNMNCHSIKNPMEQALRAKYSIAAKLNEDPRWHALGAKRITRGHAVFFPDVLSSASLASASLPDELIGCAPDLSDIQHWISKVFEYWKVNDAQPGVLGDRGVAMIKSIFARSFYVRPLLSATLEQEEQRRLQLTTEQVRILDVLQSHRRVAVSGGAGTGKTVLALEKARRLAAQGFSTLLTCYNRPLADHLADVCRDPHLTVRSFHQLCHERAKRAKVLSGRDLVEEARQTYPGSDMFDVYLPNALMYSTDIYEERFDAIVCDEGQDFRDEYWIALELLLRDATSSPLYIFFDDNQNLYSRTKAFPITDPPFVLSLNCRNTSKIHDAAYRYYKGQKVSPPPIEGQDLEYLNHPNLQGQAGRIQSRIVQLLTKESLKPTDIVVLVADSRHKLEAYSLLQRLPLPQSVSWGVEAQQRPCCVLIDTVQRFKGLESPVVFVWGLDSLSLPTDEELLYVATSRAKSLLLLSSTEETRKRLQLQMRHNPSASSAAVS